MIKPTPAPWKVEITPGLRDTVVVVNGGDDEMVCECYEGRLEERMANARLIAAAPDLLEALRSMLTNCHDADRDDAIRKAVVASHAAISKATGEKA